METQEFVVESHRHISINIVTVVEGEGVQCHGMIPEWFREDQEHSPQEDRGREEVHTTHHQYSLPGMSTRSEQDQSCFIYIVFKCASNHK